MRIDGYRSVVTRRPGWIVAFWVVLAAGIGLTAPDLTRLAAEGQARLLDDDAESVRGAEMVRRAWPEQSYESQVVVALHRPSGLTGVDRDYARRLAGRFESSPGRPADVLRVVGPGSRREVADRLISADRTLELIAVPMKSTFVAPTAEAAVAWLQGQAAGPGMAVPDGLVVHWTGDAVVGRDYMRSVQTSLDRAAMATVILLLGVLLVVYRSVWLSMVPLATIGLCLVISRGLLAWMARAGWELSPLVELFLIVLLFGTGTDFCLFISWRFGEHWDARNPSAAMRITLRRGARALVTSAGTVFVGLMLMGTNQFKLFATTGPSVALGLAVTLAASLTLTPAALVLLARWRPGSFAGMTGPSTGFWDRFAHRVLGRPVRSWLGALVLMAPLAYLGTRTTFTQDALLELPDRTPSTDGLRLVADKFGPGIAAPLAVVLRSESDFRDSEGLALIDEVSRMLAGQKWLAEVRSATRPLGSPAPFDPARISARLAAVNAGFGEIQAGADQLHDGLDQGLTRLRAARWIMNKTGLKLPIPGGPVAPDRPDPTIDQLARAVDGSGRLADGVRRASAEVSSILADPVGRRALDRLLITPETVRDHPELRESFAMYITPDGRSARLDVIQRARIFSGEAMDEVVTLRRKLADRLGDRAEPADVTALVAGANAESSDIRALTRADQVQSWYVIPIGVFLVLFFALRDPMACVNLVATMLLTYLFALGAAHLLFITILGAEGLDWKVPYFLFVLLVAVGVDYNVFLMARLHEESSTLGLRAGIGRAVAQTGGLISSAAAITAISFASLLFSPLSSLRQLGFALVVGIAVDALVVRPLLVPCGQWLLNRRAEATRMGQMPSPRSGKRDPVANRTA